MAIDQHPAVDVQPPLARWTGLEADVPERVAEVRRWQRLFGAAVAVSDLVVITVAVASAQILRFGITTDPALVFASGAALSAGITYTMVSVVMIGGWAIALRLFGTRDRRVIGSGLPEYKRVTAATLTFFGVFAIVAFLADAEVARGYLLVALPIGWAMLMLSRLFWRRWLVRHRREGRFKSHAIVVGAGAAAEHIAARIREDAGSQFVITRAAVSSATSGDELLGYVDASAADTVIVMEDHPLSPAELQELAWELKKRKARLLVAPALADCASAAHEPRYGAC